MNTEEQLEAQIELLHDELHDLKQDKQMAIYLKKPKRLLSQIVELMIEKEQAIAELEEELLRVGGEL